MKCPKDDSRRAAGGYGSGRSSGKGDPAVTGEERNRTRGGAGRMGAAPTTTTTTTTRKSPGCQQRRSCRLWCMTLWTMCSLGTAGSLLYKALSLTSITTTSSSTTSSSSSAAWNGAVLLSTLQQQQQPKQQPHYQQQEQQQSEKEPQQQQQSQSHPQQPREVDNPTPADTDSLGQQQEVGHRETTATNESVGFQPPNYGVSDPSGSSNNHEDNNNKDNVMEITIFYHVYLPEAAEPPPSPHHNTKNNLHNKLQHALDIVQEQLQMIANLTWALALTNHEPTQPVHVRLYYNTVSNGGDDATTPRSNPHVDTTTIPDSTTTRIIESSSHSLVQALIQQVCDPRASSRRLCNHFRMTCQHLAHFPNGGDERITLASLHRYCRQHRPHQPPEPTNMPKHQHGPQQQPLLLPPPPLRVTYLHNKGSFHNYPENNWWRQALTAAALHPHCLRRPPPNAATQRETKKDKSDDDDNNQNNAVRNLTTSADTILSPSSSSSSSSRCNVCGLSFEPTWAQFFPGNMWTADCDYVANLVSPNGTMRAATRTENRADQSTLQTPKGNHALSTPDYDYVQLKQQLANAVQRSNGTDIQEWNFTHYLYYNMVHKKPKKKRNQNRDDFWGTNRFAAEHWIGSHPALVPCDLSPLHFYAWTKGFYTSLKKNFSWSMAPRGSLFTKPPRYLPHVPDRDIVKIIQEQPDLRLNEYTLLAGSLYRWIGLYNQTPPLSSWVWSFYPDASYWQSKIPMIRSHVMSMLQEFDTKNRSSTRSNSNNIEEK